MAMPAQTPAGRRWSRRETVLQTFSANSFRKQFPQTSPANIIRKLFSPKDIIFGLYELFQCECVGCERDLRPMGKPGHRPPAVGCSCWQISSDLSPTLSPDEILRDSTLAMTPYLFSPDLLRSTKSLLLPHGGRDGRGRFGP